MLFITSKKLFLFSRYSNICISVVAPFSLCRPLLERMMKINLKVYGVINCLNKNFTTYFVWYLEKGKRHDIGTLAIDRVLNKEHFMEKVCRKCALKAISRPIFNFCKIGHFKKRLSKSFKKVSFIFSFAPTPF